MSTATTLTYPSVCPRCGIAHADAPERDRADALCADCRETYGHRWTQLARAEVQSLAHREQLTVAFRCGHPKDEANTYRRPDGRSPECLTCRRRRSRRSP